VKTHAVFFPFDLFGSGGTRAGAELLADAFQEMLADNKREKVRTRARAYTDHVRFQECLFQKVDDYQDWRRRGRELAAGILQRGDFLLWTAGNHLGVLPVYDALAQDAGHTLVIQLDAHLDIYNLSDCTRTLSHGNFLLHADGPLPALINLGHRELLLRPEYIARYYRHAFPASALAIDPEPILNLVRAQSRAAARVFVDLDCDVFDPAFFPGSGHPTPVGLSPPFMLRVLDAVWSERVCGLALSEFDPGRDVRDQSLATLAWLMEYVLLKRHEKG